MMAMLRRVGLHEAAHLIRENRVKAGHQYAEYLRLKSAFPSLPSIHPKFPWTRHCFPKLRPPWSPRARAFSPPTNPAAPARSASNRSTSSAPRRTAAPTASSSSPRRASSSTCRGVILFDETLRQKANDGTPFPSTSRRRASSPASRSTRARTICRSRPGEKVTEGLDGLPKRMEEYFKLGCRFAKWRAVITIGQDIPSRTRASTPTRTCSRATPRLPGSVDRADDRARGAARRQPHGRALRGSARGDAARDLCRCARVQRVARAPDPQGQHGGLRQGQPAPGAASRKSRSARVRVLKRTVPAAQPGDRVPLRRPDATRPPPRTSTRWPHGRLPVAAHVLLLARAAEPGAQDLARAGRQRRRRAEGVPPSRAHERARRAGQVEAPSSRSRRA